LFLLQFDEIIEYKRVSSLTNDKFIVIFLVSIYTMILNINTHIKWNLCYKCCNL